jgi:hypothetical protein
VKPKIDSETCPVDCTYTQSGPVCINGKSTYTVATINPAINGGKACYGNGKVLNNVGDQYSYDTNCWDCEGSWVNEGKCSVSCDGKGTVKQNFVVSKNEGNSGTCPNRGKSQVVDCDNGKCYFHGKCKRKEDMETEQITLISPGVCRLNGMYGELHGKNQCRTYNGDTGESPYDCTAVDLLFVNKNANTEWVDKDAVNGRPRVGDICFSGGHNGSVGTDKDGNTRCLTSVGGNAAGWSVLVMNK